MFPAAWLNSPLGAIYAPLVSAFDGGDWPDASALDAFAARFGPVLTSTGRPVRFVEPCLATRDYERCIARTGWVGSRVGAHDFCNALVWLRFPRTKAALNAAHVIETECNGGGVSARGARRDALTQFDEDGAVVVSTEPELLEALARHEWRRVFWDERERLMRSTRFVAIGHALLDKLRRPFVGVCARALYLELSSPGLLTDEAGLLAWTDAELASRIDLGWPRAPAQLRPLPALGIPGQCAENVDAGYYADTRQFRPLRANCHAGR